MLHYLIIKARKKWLWKNLNIKSQTKLRHAFCVSTYVFTLADLENKLN